MNKLRRRKQEGQEEEKRKKNDADGTTKSKMCTVSSFSSLDEYRMQQSAVDQLNKSTHMRS